METGTRRHIVALVAANGVGHLRRTLGVLDRMISLAPELEIDLVAEPGSDDLLRT